MSSSVHFLHHQNTSIRPRLLSERFASTASFQFYDRIFSSRSLATYVTERFCKLKDDACVIDAQRISSADSIDIDYDAVSQSFEISVYIHEPPPSEKQDGPEVWNDLISNYEGYIATEVGLLHEEKPREAEHLKLGGYLIVIGKDEKASMSSCLNGICPYIEFIRVHSIQFSISTSHAVQTRRVFIRDKVYKADRFAPYPTTRLQRPFEEAVVNLRFTHVSYNPIYALHRQVPISIATASRI